LVEVEEIPLRLKVAIPEEIDPLIHIGEYVLLE
jgi:hypothetical protein